MGGKDSRSMSWLVLVAIIQQGISTPEHFHLLTPSYFKYLHFLSFYFIYFFNKCIYLFIYFWLRWVFVAARGLFLVAASRDYSSLQCAGFSLWWLLLLPALGLWASVVVARRLRSCGSQAEECRLSSCGARA